MKNNVLVTGGASFIGSHLSESLLREGYEVHVLDNLSSGKESNIPNGASLHLVDLRDQDSIDSLLKRHRFSAIFHDAAQMSVTRSVKNPEIDAHINIVGTINLLRACVHNRVQKVIFASSGGVIYGNPITSPQKENHPLQPVSPYGISKMTCERYLQYFWEYHGINYVALRYANVYGPRQSPKSGAGIIGIFMEKISKNEQPIINGSGTKTRDYVYINDVVRANLLALNYHGVGPFNVGTGIETDVNTVFRQVSKILQKNIPEVHGPDNPGEQLRSVLDITRAKQQLNWKPATKFEDGLRKTIEWYQSTCDDESTNNNG